MKLLSRILVGIVVVFAFASCGPSSQEMIEATARELNEQAPINYGGGLVLEKAAYENGNFVYYYRLPEVGISEEELPAVKASMFTAEVLADPEVSSFMETLIDNGCSIIYRYSDYNGNTMDVSFTPEELSDLLK